MATVDLAGQKRSVISASPQPFLSEVDKLVEKANCFAADQDYYSALENRAKALMLNRELEDYSLFKNNARKGIYTSIFKKLSSDSLALIVNSLQEEYQTPELLNVISDVAESKHRKFALACARKALNKSKVLKDLWQEAYANYNLGNLLYSKDNIPQAKPYAFRAYQFFSGSDDTLAIIRSASLSGSIDKWLYKFKQAEEYYGEALDLAKATKDDESVIDVLGRWLNVKTMQGDYAGFNEISEMFMKISEGFGDEYYLVEAKWLVATFLLELGRFKEAKPWLQLGIEYDEKHKKYHYFGHDYYHYGICYAGLGIYDTAFIHLQKSLDYSLKYDDEENYIGAVKELALLHFEIGNEEQALDYSGKIFDYCHQFDLSKDTSQLLEFLYWKLTLAEKTQELDSALLVADQYIELANRFGAKGYYLPSIIKMKGKVQQQLGALEAAKKTLSYAVEVARESGQKREEVEALCCLAENEFKSGAYPNAVQYAEKSLYLAKSIRYVSALNKIYQVLAEANSRISRYKEAFFYQTKLDYLEDSLFGFVQKAQIAKYEAMYKIKEQGLENEKLRTEKERNLYILRKRNFLILLLGLIIVFTIITAYLLKERAKAMARKKLRSEISKDVHDDVGGILNNLKMTAKEALEQKTDNALVESKLKRTVDLGNDAMDSLRNLIWQLDVEKVNLKDFSEEIKNSTEGLLSRSRISYELDISGFDAQKTLPPKVHHHLLMIYKEALQNALKHGDQRRVWIRFSHCMNTILLVVRNSLMESSPNKSGTNKGLANMKERTEIMGGDMVTEKRKGFFELRLQLKI